MVVCQGESPFSTDVKGGDNVVGRVFMIAGGVLVFPSIPKGEVVDQWLSLMSTQAAPRATSILHVNFYLANYYIMSQGLFLWFLLVDIFLLIYGSSHNSSRF